MSDATTDVVDQIGVGTVENAAAARHQDRPATVGTPGIDERRPKSTAGPIAFDRGSKASLEREGERQRGAGLHGPVFGRERSNVHGTVTATVTFGSEGAERRSVRDRRGHALSLCRPRCRRERSTARPPRVALRARTPCFMARLRLLGWKVRFMAGLLESRRIAEGTATADPGGGMDRPSNPDLQGQKRRSE